MSICVKFHQNWPNGVATNCCDRHTDRHTDVQTYLIPGVNIFRHEMTKNIKLLRSFAPCFMMISRSVSINNWIITAEKENSEFSVFLKMTTFLTVL